MKLPKILRIAVSESTAAPVAGWLRARGVVPAAPDADSSETIIRRQRDGHCRRCEASSLGLVLASNRIARALVHHTPITDKWDAKDVCRTCNDSWPCKTWKALQG